MYQVKRRLEALHPALFVSDNLGKLLLDEEGPQVRQLPSTGDAQHNELDEDPADNTAVGVLGLVAELGFALLVTTLAFCIRRRA